MAYKTLDSFNFKGKLVLVRVDVNSEIRNGKVMPSDRITESRKTISELQKKGAKVVVIAHQGRPNSKDFTNLEQHAKLLKIKFINDVIGNRAITAIRNLENGKAILLDNIRKVKDELVVPKKAKDNILVERFAPLFDYYVNDAFSVSHRVQTSITVFPKYITPCIGRTMEMELNNLKKLNIKDCTFILGGAKPDDVALLLKEHYVLTSGVIGNLCLIAKGHKLGMEDELKNKYKDVFAMLKRNLLHVEAPVDVAAYFHGKRWELSLEELPINAKLPDIGIGTANLYSKIIMNSTCVFMKGTAGMAESKDFDKGTRMLLKAMEKTKAFTVIAGGNTITAMKRFGIKNIDYVSLSGGALVYYLAGKKLPGLEALK